ncbi:MAG: undecaprenyl-diphosphate phosphatase [Clostridiales bacterium]|jgi:undecaprenyl-diphosphatase|nr:undecaprenyl-diphosphate phosphatase [Clostridiales bacterium]
MDIIQAVILGIIQGLTEFLPVSSSGHLLLLEKLGIGSPSVFFNLALHAGTLFSAVIFYRKNIFALIKNPFGRDSVRLIAATATTGILAFAAERFFGEILEGRYLAIGFMLTAAALFSAEAFKGGKAEKTKEAKGDKNDNVTNSKSKNSESPKADKAGVFKAVDPETFKENNGGKTNSEKAKSGEISLKSAVFCGVCQGIAVIPGLSRSGATVASLLFCGADKEKAANFSFMLSMPVIAAGFVVEAVKNQAFSLPSEQIFPMLIGMAAAAASGFFAIKSFVRFLKKKSMKGFAYYTAALAALCGAIFGVV